MALLFPGKKFLSYPIDGRIWEICLNEGAGVIRANHTCRPYRTVYFPKAPVLFMLSVLLLAFLLHQEKVQKYLQFLPEHIFQLPAYGEQPLLKIRSSYLP